MKPVVLAFLCLCAALAGADTLDFARQAVIVSGVAVGPSEQTGPGNLNARAIEVLKAANYDRTWTVAAYLTSHPLALRKLGRLQLETRRSGTKFLSDGAVSTEYELPIAGPVLNLILPPTGGGKLLGKTACPCCGQRWPEGVEPGPNVKLVPCEDQNAPTFTGILIDVRGLGYRPAVFPRVVNELEEEVIGSSFAKPENLAASGQVAYYRDRTEAFSSERVGANPLVIRALRATGLNKCDIVVSNYDAGRIHGSKANLELLGECRVGLLTD